jgi:thioredoxin 1
MKRSIAKLFSSALIAAVIVTAIPALSAGKKPAPNIKAGTACQTPLPRKTAAKPAIQKKPVANKKPAAKPASKVARKLPRLLDLGATKCIPCKMMVPVLDSLKKEYKGKLQVEFIDVWENRSAGGKYKINSIPTQIFYDANGREFFRHAGYYPKEDILAKFKEHGINLVKGK